MPTPSKWHIEFYPPGDDGPWLKSLRGLKDVEAEREIALWLEVLEDVGPFELLRQQRVKKLQGTNIELFELRIRKGRSYRVLFCNRDRVLWVLSLVVKKTKKLARQDIETAMARASNLP